MGITTFDHVRWILEDDWRAVEYEEGQSYPYVGHY